MGVPSFRSFSWLLKLGFFQFFVEGLFWESIILDDIFFKGGAFVRLENNVLMIWVTEGQDGRW